jgi:hypothetical protein
VSLERKERASPYDILYRSLYLLGGSLRTLGAASRATLKARKNDMLMYTKSGDFMRCKATDMAELDTEKFLKALDGAVKYLCGQSKAPGDEPDMLAQALSFEGEGALAYLHLALSTVCANNAG